jgi:hypothetical protein
MILDSIEQLGDLKSRVLFLYPITKDSRLHKHSNTIIGFVFIDTNTKESFTLSSHHPEGLFQKSDLDFLKEVTVYCHDIMVLRYNGYDVSNFIDTKMQYYLYTNQGHNPDTPSIVNHYTRQFQTCYKTNEFISLYKHEQIAMDIFNEVWIKEVQPGLSFYQEDLMDAFYNIEKNGLQINTTLFEERFGQTLSRDNQLCFSEYNYYTTTGRPSNRFGGINFAALNKDDDTRDTFISRHANGSLLELDFNSYHPRLIATLIDYDFGTDNVYEHLATYYANNSNPTKEEISDAKESTFRQLYGGINHQYLHIPFFKKTDNFAKYLWETINTQGYIESPVSGRRLVLANYQDITCYTLFNYFVQMYETECNVLILQSIHKMLKGYDTKPILYTYDSILFDVEGAELKYLTDVVIPQSINLEKFPIKIKQGTTYKNISI